ncbi:hypothetical protein AB1K09_20190 [Solibacillus silvestris]
MQHVSKEESAELHRTILNSRIEMFRALHQAHLYYKENERLQAALKAVENKCYNGSSYFEVAETARKALRGEPIDT